MLTYFPALIVASSILPPSRHQSFPFFSLSVWVVASYSLAMACPPKNRRDGENECLSPLTDASHPFIFDSMLGSLLAVGGSSPSPAFGGALVLPWIDRSLVHVSRTVLDLDRYFVQLFTSCLQIILLTYREVIYPTIRSSCQAD